MSLPSEEISSFLFDSKHEIGCVHSDAIVTVSTASDLHVAKIEPNLSCFPIEKVQDIQETSTVLNQLLLRDELCNEENDSFISSIPSTSSNRTYETHEKVLTRQFSCTTPSNAIEIDSSVSVQSKIDDLMPVMSTEETTTPGVKNEIEKTKINECFDMANNYSSEMNFSESDIIAKFGIKKSTIHSNLTQSLSSECLIESKRDIIANKAAVLPIVESLKRSKSIDLGVLGACHKSVEFSFQPENDNTKFSVRDNVLRSFKELHDPKICTEEDTSGNADLRTNKVKLFPSFKSPLVLDSCAVSSSVHENNGTNKVEIQISKSNISDLVSKPPEGFSSFPTNSEFVWDNSLETASKSSIAHLIEKIFRLS